VDSRAIDAPPDGPPPDAADPTHVWVHVISPAGDGFPDPTAIAIFMDPSGTVVQDGLVDSNGDASTLMPGGGTVTVLQVSVDSANSTRREQITTFRGVKGGDSLHVGRKDPTVLSGHPDTMTATMPLDAYAGVLIDACGGAEQQSGPPNGTQTFTFYDSCRTSTFDILMLDNMGGTPEFVWQPGVTFSEHGDVMIADNFQLMSQNTTTVANIAANVTGGVRLYTMIGTWPLQMGLKSITPQSSPSTQVMAMPYAPGAGSGTLVYVEEVTGIEPLQQFAMLTTGSASNLSVDVSQLPVPTVAARATQTTSGASWTQTDAGAPDARYVTWIAQWTDSAASMNHVVDWAFVEDPSGPTTSALVPLPDAYAADDPTKASGVTLGGANVWYVDYDNLSGYDDARRFGPALTDVATRFLTVDHRVHESVSP
jgi:hypothetical protein